MSISTIFFFTYTVPPPVVILTYAMDDQLTITLNAGANALFNCLATVDTTFADTPVNSVIKWMIGDTHLESHDRFYISETESDDDINGTTTFYSEIEIAPVLKDDEAVLVCTVFVTDDSSNEYILKSPNANASLTLKIEGIIMCMFEEK